MQYQQLKTNGQHDVTTNNTYPQTKPQQHHFQSLNHSSDKFLKALQALCSRYEAILEVQNNRIYNLEKGYGSQISEKFDRLISVNQSIDQSLLRLLQRSPFQAVLQGTNSEVHRTKQIQIVPKTSLIEVKTSSNQDYKKNPSYSQKIQQPKSNSQQTIKPNTLVDNRDSLIKGQRLQNPLLERKLSKTGLISIFKDFANNGVMVSHLGTIRHFHRYIGEFYNRNAKYYYQLFSSGKITYQDIKIRFSTDIFNELIQFQGQWIEFILTLKMQELGKCHSNGKMFYKIFNQASIQSLRFLIHKYPPSRTNLVDNQLSQKIKQIKTFSVVKYDLLKNAQMQFGVVQGQTDFSKQIKIWLNKIILETRKQYPIFKQRMRLIFTGNDSNSLDGTNRDNDLQYSICSKIPENTQVYSQEQINALGLIIKNPELLRVLIKWYEELIIYFINPEEKIKANRYGFKSIHNKSIPIRIPQSKLELLSQNLRKIYREQILPKQSQEHFNIGVFVQGLISISLGGIEGYDFINEREIIVSKMSECLYEVFKSHLLTFLNLCLEKLVKVRSKYDSESFESNIQLITFGIMDILRCRCTGSKQQIYRIYHQIIKNTDYFQIIRVKNKLNEPTKDILINLKIKQSFLICEVQLALGTSKQHTNSDFCHYLYELERSKFGVLFECASQIYNFDPKVGYLKKNPKIQFKKKSLIREALMEKIRVTDCLQCNSCHPYKKMIKVQNTRPFICLCCMSFIPGYYNKLPFYRCEICNFTICHQCTVQLGKKSEDMMKKIFDMTMPSNIVLPSELYHSQFKNIGIYDRQEVEKLLLSVINQYHNYALLLVIDDHKYNFGIFKKYKNTIVETFSTISEIPQMSINTQAQKAISAIIPLRSFKIRKISELTEMRKIHIYFSWCKLQGIFDNNKIDQVVCIFTKDDKQAFVIDVIESQLQIQQHKLKRSVQRIMQKSNKSKGACLQITSKGLNNLNFLQKLQNKDLITTLNLWQNKFKDISILSQFQNIQQLYLEQNQIESIQPILHMSKLQLLTLGTNKIGGKLPKLELPQLQYLTITHNSITDICNLGFSNTKSIILLKLSNTLITKLPKMDFPKLQLLKADNCKINDILEFSKSNLPFLSKLNLQFNQISGQMLKLDFPVLSTLRLCHNKITSLNDFRGSNLPFLNTFKISDNSLNSQLLPMTFKQLIELDLSFNQLSKVSQSFFTIQNFPKLERLILRNNKFQGPVPIILLKNLKKLDMGQNLLCDLNIDLNYHQNLQQAYFDHNKISQPVGIKKHPSLRIIDVSFNQITDIRNMEFWRVPELRQIRFNNNLISCPIPKLYLSNLQYLDLSNNKFTDQKLVQFLHLVPHSISINLSNNPKVLQETIKRKYSISQIKSLSFV